MGCCNKQHEGRTISRRRYVAGLVALRSVQVGFGAALVAASVPWPRYRKLLPFFLEYTQATFDSVMQRDGIRVEDEACSVDPPIDAWVDPAAAWGPVGG